MTRARGRLTRLLADLDLTPRAVLVLAGLFVLVGLFTLALWLNDRSYAKTGPGELVGAHLEQRDGTTVIACSTIVDLGEDSPDTYRIAAIDPVTGKVIDRRVVDRLDDRSGPSPLGGSHPITGGELYFTTKPRATLMFTDHRGGERAMSEDAWLRPAFIAYGGDGVVVAHHDTIDPTAHLLVTAVTPEGAKRWTTTLGVEEIRAAFSIDDTIVLGLHVNEGQGSVVALDAADGHVLWRTGT